MCKKLNGSVLKSLKPKWSGSKLEIKLVWPGPGQNFVFRFGPDRDRTKILIFLSDRDGLGPKHLFLFRHGRTRAKIFILSLGRSGPDPCRPLGCMLFKAKMSIC